MIIVDNYILDDLKHYITDHLLHKSGNKVVDDFIRYTQVNSNLGAGMMEFVPYGQFKDIEFIAEGGFSKVYRATWIDGYTYCWDKKKLNFKRVGSIQVALKKLNNSEKITYKELNEVYNLIIIYGSFAIKIESRNIVNHMIRNVILIANRPYLNVLMKFY